MLHYSEAVTCINYDSMIYNSNTEKKVGKTYYIHFRMT